ncbi:10896_t:CDS:2, partial [Racocetra persica]
MEVRFIEFSNEDYGGLKYNEKGKMKQKVDNSTMMKKLVKTNGQAARASISTGSSMNLISRNYVKKQRLTWRHLNKEPTIGHIGNKIVGYIPSAKIDINGISNKEESTGSEIMANEEYAMNDERENKFVDVRLNKRKSIHSKDGNSKNQPGIDEISNTNNKNDDSSDERTLFESSGDIFEESEHETFVDYQES